VKALIVDSYGDWRQVRFDETELRLPAADEVLLEMRATSLNFPDMLMIEGKYQTLPALPFISGRDASGIVVSVGEDVKEFAVEDRVAVQPGGDAYSEQTISHAHYCTKTSDAVSFEDATACNATIAPVVAAVSLRVELQPGEWILIIGGGGEASTPRGFSIRGRPAGAVSR
jgi:NADPH2:quinone reductase